MKPANRHSGMDAGIQAMDGNSEASPWFLRSAGLRLGFHVLVLDFGIPAEMTKVGKFFGSLGF